MRSKYILYWQVLNEKEKATHKVDRLLEIKTER